MNRFDLNGSGHGPDPSLPDVTDLVNRVHGVEQEVAELVRLVTALASHVERRSPSASYGSDLERGEAILAESQRPGANPSELPARFRVGRRRLYQLMTLALLPEKVKAVVRRHGLSESVVRPFLSLEGADRVAQALNFVAERRLRRSQQRLLRSGLEHDPNLSLQEVWEKAHGGPRGGQLRCELGSQEAPRGLPNPTHHGGESVPEVGS